MIGGNVTEKELQKFKDNHIWIIEEIFEEAIKNLPWDKFEEYYDDYQGYSCTYSNNAVNVFLKHFPLEEIFYFDSYYQGLYDNLDVFYTECEEFNEDPLFQCDFDRDDYVMYEDYVFDKNPHKEGPFV